MVCDHPVLTVVCLVRQGAWGNCILGTLRRIRIMVRCWFKIRRAGRFRELPSEQSARMKDWNLPFKNAAKLPCRVFYPAIQMVALRGQVVSLRRNTCPHSAYLDGPEPVEMPNLPLLAFAYEVDCEVDVSRKYRWWGAWKTAYHVPAYVPKSQIGSGSLFPSLEATA